jgi:AcrR family transcriptional regulator
VTHFDDATAGKIADRLSSATGKTRRADAQRNTLRLIRAAQATLDDLGVQANSHEIARRAGVGVGTFYRQFGSLNELLAVVLTDLLDQIITAGRAGLADPDPWNGFVSFAEVFVRLGSLSCGVKDAVRGQEVLDLQPAVESMSSQITDLVTRAQEAGIMRPDVSWHDVACVLASAFPPPSTLGVTNGPDQWRRSLDIVLAGLRT